MGSALRTVLRRSLAGLGTALLAGCAVAPPTGPTVMVLPGKDKTFAAFRQDDATCEQYAAQRTGRVSPAAAGQQSGLASAGVGAALGAATGAAIGSATGHVGTGAGLGAAGGLLLGSLIGFGNSQAAADSVQGRYNMAYVQCMAAKGDRIPSPPRAVYSRTYLYPAYPYPGYGYPGFGYPGYYGYPDWGY